MALEYAEVSTQLDTYPESFRKLDEKLEEQLLSPEDMKRFGQYNIVETYLMETPAEILEAGWVLTNPSPIIMVQDGPHAGELFAYFRAEPRKQHLGRTMSIPYLIKFDSDGRPSLERFEEIMAVPGEDPRVIQNVPYTDENGELQVGWCVITVVATPVSETDMLDPSLVTDEDRETVDHIDQVVYCGQSLSDLKEVVRIRGLKNMNPSPVEDPEHPGRMVADIFGRPKPHITYCGRIDDIRKLTAEMIENGIVITADYLRISENGNLPADTSEADMLNEPILDPAWATDRERETLKQISNTPEQGAEDIENDATPDSDPEPDPVHTGVNTSRRVEDQIELDIHDACAPMNADGKRELHYRLSRAAYELPSREHPKGIFKPLGVIACRNNFPYAPPKPPEGEVADFYDVLYGSKGDTVIEHIEFGPVEIMVTGMSDTTVGIALLRRNDAYEAYEAAAAA